MNNRGMNQVGTLLIIFIAVVVVVALIPSIASNIAGTTQTNNVVNASITFPSGTTPLVLNGQAVSNVFAINATSGVVINSGNWTITNYDISTGTLRATIQNVTNNYAGQPVNISYTYEPLGYATDAGSRAIIALILVLAALALLAVVVGKVFDVDVFGWLRS